MATRRYRKNNKRSLKKRGSRRRKNIRSSRRMRGGIECVKNNDNLCEFNFEKDKYYKDSSVNEQTLIWQKKSPTIYKFIEKQEDNAYCLLKKESNNNKHVSKNYFVDQGDYLILDSNNNNNIITAPQNYDLNVVSKHKADLKKTIQYIFTNNNDNTIQKFNSCVDYDFLIKLIKIELPV